MFSKSWTGFQDRKFLVWLLLVNFLSFGISLLHSGYYWDDWTLVGNNTRTIYDFFISTGRPPLAYLHSLGFALSSSVLFYKVLIFFVHIGTAYLMKFFLDCLGIAPEDSALAALFFAVLPYNQTRESLVISQYMLSLFLLMTGVVLIQKNRGSLVLRVAAYPILWLSFTIEANLLLLPALLAVVICVKEHLSLNSSRKQIFQGFVKFLDYLLLPFAYLLFRRFFFRAYGINSGLNDLAIDNITLLPISFLKALVAGAVRIPYYALVRGGLFFLLVVALIYFGLRWPKFFYSSSTTKTQDKKTTSFHANLFLILSGGFACLVTLIPFLMVGKLPHPWDWSSRTLCFLSPGLALIFLGVYRNFNSLKFMKSWVYLTISILISVNLMIRLDYYRDYLKQVTLIKEFKGNQSLGNTKWLNVDDRTADINTLKREYRFYEWSGLLKMAFGDQTRVGLLHDNEAEFAGIQLIQKSPFTKMYNIGDIDMNAEQKTLLIDFDSRHVSLFETLEILASNLLHKQMTIPSGWIKIKVLDGDETLPEPATPNNIVKIKTSI